MAHLETLAGRVGALLQDARARREISQATLAQWAGTTQQCVSSVERGRARTTAQLDRLFAALGLQLRVEAEPVGTDLDPEIGEIERWTEADRLELFSLYHRRLDQLGELPYVLSGRLGAFVQGAPLRPERMDLVVAADALEAFAEWFRRTQSQRWHESWRDWGYDSVDPREPGPMRWLVGFDEIRLAVPEEPPPTVIVVVGDRRLRVCPLPHIEREHPDVARLMRRVRARRAGGTVPA